jgi:hypothetical protein
MDKYVKKMGLYVQNSIFNCTEEWNYIICGKADEIGYHDVT